MLSPAFAHTLRELGYADRVVARHAFDLALDPALPVAGDQHGVSYETLIAARPTVVLMETGATDVPPRLVELAARESFAIVRLPALSLDDVRRSIGRLDRLARGAASEAPRSPSADEQLARWDATLGPPEEPAGHPLGATVSLLHMQPIGLAGPGSFSAQIVDRLGGVSIPPDGLAYQSVSAEELIAMQPTTIVAYMPGATADEVRAHRGRLASLGLASDRLVVIDGRFSLLPSVALIEVAESIAAHAAAWHEPAR